VLLLVGGTYYEKTRVSAAKHTRDNAVAQLKKLQAEQYNLLNPSGPGSGPTKASDATRKAAASAILAQDIQWAADIDEIGNNDLPAGVLFSSVSGTRTQVASQPSVAPSGSGSSGSGGAAAGAASNAVSSSNAASSATAGATGSTPAATGAAGASALGGPAPVASCKAVELSVVAGTFTFQGTAPSVPAIAQTLDNMNKDKVIGGALLTSAQATTTGSTKLFSFTISAQLNSGARGNRLEEFKLCK